MNRFTHQLCVLTQCGVLLGAALVADSAQASHWAIDRLNSVSLDTNMVPAVELSGVTYIGPSSTPGNHLFVAVQDSGGQLIAVDVAFNANGSIATAKATEQLGLVNILDFEGAVFTDFSRNSVFLSEETNPGVREYSTINGNLLQTVSFPSLFGTLIPNRGFESLARSPDGSVMWTANEESLSIDGLLSTPSNGTTVRLVEMDVVGNAVTVGSQFAYEVNPVHASGFSNQSGLSELLSLPDGSLLAMERSFAAFASPTYLNSIYLVDFSGATDVSTAPWSDGLIGETYTPVGKELLWAGTADGSSGQNLEGIALGPRLPDGSWIVLGVVDNGDPFSANTIVSFLLTAEVSADFDENGTVDGTDFLAWQQGLGITAGASHADGDADRDGDVDADDLALWEAAYPGPLSAHGRSVPEPGAATLSLAMLLASVAFRPTQRSSRAVR